MLQRIVDGRTDLVFEYVSDGGSAESSNHEGVRLIKWCAYHGDVSAIRFLLLNGESMESLGENYGLAEAAFHGHWQLCQFLIEAGADVNFRQPDTGETPLHASLCKANRPNYDHIVSVLIAHGADPNVGTRPEVETGQFMRDCRTKAETALHRAAAFGTLRAIDMLLEAGADRAAMDINGDSPLSWASWHLRPAPVLRALCYDGFSIHDENESTYDHGTGWGNIDLPMLGHPHNH